MAAAPVEEALAIAFPGLTAEEVLALREARAFRLLRGRGAAGAAALLGIADLDAYLRTDGARCPRVSMADESRQGSAAVPAEEYALPDGRVDLPRLLQRFDAGASLVISQFQESHPPLARFCRALEKLFLHGVQANIYLTPPSAQGFRTHYDTHDVLVLQVAGRKAWRVWEGEPLPRPTRRTPWHNAIRPQGEPHRLTLSPGDALYIPRGLLHDAATEGAEASLHVTVGLLEPCWAEALRRLLDAEEAANPALRESVPSWRLGEADGIAHLAALLAAKLAELGGLAQAERLSLLLLEQLAQDRQPLPARGLFLPPLDPARPLRLADGMHHHVARGADGAAVLRWTCGEISLPPEALPWLDALAEGVAPAALGEAAAPFIERLRRLGLLEPA